MYSMECPASGLYLHSSVDSASSMTNLTTFDVDIVQTYGKEQATFEVLRSSSMHVCPSVDVDQHLEGN